MQSKIELAKVNPQALLDVVLSDSGKARSQAISLLRMHCTDWQVLVELINAVEGEYQIDIAAQVSGRLAASGDFESVDSLLEELNPGAARAKAMNEVLVHEVLSGGPLAAFERLLSCEPDELPTALRGFRSGCLDYFKDAELPGPPNLADYEGVKGAVEAVARSYVVARGSRNIDECLDFLHHLEASEQHRKLVPDLLDRLIQSTREPPSQKAIGRISELSSASLSRFFREISAGGGS
jgi:hypothetical protein